MARECDLSGKRKRAAMRFNEVVAKFINKDLIACVHCASRNNVAATIKPAGENR